MKISDTALPEVFYEAAFNPSRWPEALGLLANAAGGTGAVLSVRESRRYRIYATASVETEVRRRLSNPGPTGIQLRRDRNERSPCMFADTAYFGAAGSRRQSPCCDIVLRDQSADDAASHSEPIGSVHLSVVGLKSMRQIEPAAEACDRFSHHVVRALSIEARARQSAIVALVENLALAGVAAAVIDETGRQRSANSHFIARTKGYLAELRDPMRFGDRVLQSRFSSAIAAISANGRSKSESIGVAGADGKPHLVLHLLPFLDEHWLSYDDNMIVIVGADNSAQIVSADVLKMLFDLTPAEARLTRLLLEGESVETAAKILHVSVMTVRVHLRSIFAKVGVERQTQLVRHLMGLGCPVSQFGTG